MRVVHVRRHCGVAGVGLLVDDCLVQGTGLPRVRTCARGRA
ncbi:hypothetical protein NY08_1640 [Rhodococcus sp. B7740]|nr:hypothetical protein NY08_1640 [Rhodococcus sp. B7740]